MPSTLKYYAQMIKWIYIFCFLILPLSVNAQFTQNKLQGQWVVFKTEKNGKQTSEKKYYRIQFGDSTLHIETNAASNFSKATKYSLKGSSIIAQNGYKLYDIELLSKDTLALKSGEVTTYMTKMYYIIEQEQLMQSDKDTFYATTNASPLLNKNIIEEISPYDIDSYLKTIGVIYLILDKKKVIVEIKKSTEKDNTPILNLLQSSYKDWNTGYFDKYKVIAIPFFISANLIKSIHEGLNSNLYSNLDLVTALNLIEVPNDLDTKVVDMKTFNADYKKGLKCVEKQDYEAAANYFSKALEILPQNGSILFNLGAVYFKLNQKDKACECFQKLKEKGDEEATKIYNQYCQ